MPHHAHARIQSERRLFILWWRSALDSARLASYFAVSPQMLIGGTKVSHETDNLTLKKQLLNEWNDGNGTLAALSKAQ